MEAAAVHPRLLGRDVTELIEDAADDLVSPALPAQHLELIHHAVQRQSNAGDGVVGVTVTLAVQLMVAALEFLAIELREQGHTKEGVHGLSWVCRSDTDHSSEPRPEVSTGDLAGAHPARNRTGDHRRH